MPEPTRTSYSTHYSGGQLRTVLCDDGRLRLNRKQCRRLGLLKTKRQKRLAKRREARGG